MQKYLRNVGARLIAPPARLLFRLIKLLTLSLLGAAVAVTIIAVRHLLNTPQRLDSTLPGEARIYRWKHGHISYNVLGAENAPPLVLLHNLGIDASSYEMRTIIEPLAKYYRVYAPDLIGFGLSDRPSLDYSAETYVSLCRDFLTEVVQQPARPGTSPAPTLLASGLTCNYAIAIAQTVPTLCERLVLISPIALLSGDAQKAIVGAGLPTLSPGQRPALIPSCFAPVLESTRLQKLLEIPLIQSLLFALLVRATLATARRSHSIGALSGAYGARFNTFALLVPTQRDINYLYTTTHRFGAEHAPMALLAGKLIPDISEQLETLQQPTLIIWGAGRGQAQPLHTAHALTKNNADGLPPNSQLALLPDAGLYVHEECPEIIVSTIREWSTEGQASEPLRIEAYCVKCKTKTQIKDPHEVTLKNGSPAIRGTCSVCETNVFRIGRLVAEI
jgi:pimeloyl-ACP methyl ester carboxylesterase